MFQMAVGHSDAVTAADAIAAAIEQCRDSLGDTPASAALLFVGHDLVDPLISAAVRAAFPAATIVGCSSAAAMSSVGGYTEDGLTLTVFASDTVDITAGIAQEIEADSAAGARAAVEHALAATSRTPQLCIVLADALAGEAALEAAKQALPRGVTVVGGAACGPDLATSRPNFEFDAERIVENGVVVLLFSGPLLYSVAVGTGLRPIGRRGVVTRSVYGQIAEIDGRPALAFVEPYVGQPGPATFGNPLAFRQSENEKWYLRAMLGSDPATGAIDVPGVVPEGASVQLTTATTDEIVGATTIVAREAVDSFPGGAAPQGALLFSCQVRKFMLGSKTAREVVEARSVLPPAVPVAGMYCVGEIAPTATQTESRFHNETFVTLLLGA